MVEYTLLEKIKTLFDLITSSPLFLILLSGIILMIIDMLFISNKDKKTQKIYLIVSILLIILILNLYFNSILSILDTISKNIVTIIYFPTILQYVIMLIISIVILLVSIFNKRINKIIKRINIFVLILNTFLFFLILDQINNNNVDLSNKISIYSNSHLMILLELSILIFVIWIISLILYLIIKKLQNKKTIEETNMFYEKPKLPEKFEELQMPKRKTEYVTIEREKTDELFTLEEYKKMRELLEHINKDKD